MGKDRNFNRISVAIYLFFGMFLATNQVLIESIAEHLGASTIEMGRMISSIYAGSMAAVLVFGELAHAIGKRQSSMLASAVVASGAFLVSSADSVLLVTAGFFIYGCGIGGFESVLTSMLADNNGENSNRFLNILQSLFSMGAVVAPIILAAMFRGTAYRLAYGFMALWYGFLILYMLLNKRLDLFLVQTEKEKSGPVFFRLIKNPVLVAYMSAMFIFIGSESAFTYWIGNYMEASSLGAYSAAALSIYWFSSIVGKLIASRFRSPLHLIAPGFFSAAAGCVLLVMGEGLWLKFLAIAIVGTTFAPLYAGLALLGGGLYPKASAPAISMMIFSAGLGGVMFQPVISLLAASGSPGRAYILIAALCSAMGVLMFALARSGKARTPAE